MGRGCRSCALLVLRSWLLIYFRSCTHLRLFARGCSFFSVRVHLQLFVRGCSLFSVRVPLRLFARKQTTKLSQLATSMKAANEAAERWHRKVKQYREECIELPKDQGDAVHKFLIDKETRELLDKKLPPKSEQRAYLNVRSYCCFYLLYLFLSFVAHDWILSSAPPAPILRSD